MELDHSELKSFTNSLGYTTLYDFNHKTGLPVDSIKIQTQDVYLSMLLNKDGILMIGDTILKITENDAFIIEDGNFETVKQINSRMNTSKLKNVIVKSHSKNLNPINDVSEMRKLRGTESKYDGFVQTGLTKSGTNYPREERVEFSAFSVVSPFWPFGLTYIGAKMNGEARQKDVWWGKYWGSWFNDEINYGEITINSGKWGPENNCIENIVPGTKVFNTADKEMKYAREYGPTNNLHAKNLSVTYKYRKTPGFSIHSTTIVWE